MTNTKEEVLKEIEELQKKRKKEEKRDIYSGELVRIHSKFQFLDGKLEGVNQTLAEVKKNPEELGLIDKKKVFPKEKGYIFFDEDQYFEHKKKLRKEFLAEVGKVIDEWLNRYCTHGNRVGQDNCIGCIKELKEALGIK